ncbi:MAG TPA: tetratricopeptide repeat protein [Anaeromyxobacteraceae bacterium]|jgi:tetratricopeptide (TPR) repeat protein
MWGYRTRDVARMLGLAPARVRALARAGLVEPRRGPGGALLFSFQDLVLLRAAAGLASARVPAARLRRALASLRARLPAGRSLASVRISADGDRVVVRDGRGAWRPESGQALFDFAVSSLGDRVAPLLREAASATDPSGLDAQAFYAWGCDLEAGAPEQARRAYARALELDPDHPGANLNLGRLLHEAGDAPAAEGHYRRALDARPGDAVALFDLGVSLEDQRRDGDALLAYARCLAADPAQADAHFNAARILERLGRRPEALRHLAAYRRLQRGDAR